MRNEMQELFEKREELRKQLSDIADKGNISPEHEQMLRVFAFGLRMRGYEIKDVLVASDAFSTFMAIWSNDTMRELALKVVSESVGE